VTKTLDDLNRIFRDAEEVDRDIFAEMRSNLLLIAGEHYDKVNKKAAANVRTSKSANSGTSEQKLRLTKNHMHKVKRTYKTAILEEAPSTTITPKNPTEMQDVKDAEMNQSVWADIKHRHHMDARVDDWADQFVSIGEVCVKIYWNPSAGQFLGYAPKVDEDGNPVLQDDPSGAMEEVQLPDGSIVGQPVQIPVDDETQPQFAGDFEFEDVFGFNLLRESGTTRMEEHGKAWVIRKMMETKSLQKLYPDEAEKIQETANETYVVFDSSRGTYQKKKGETLVREFYWAPCEEYPEGWYCVSTANAVLAEGPLPYGIFPLVWEGFDKHPSTPRGRSIIKVARPWQAEINRASSQMAVAQVTLGDDKILYQAGAKLSQGALLPGVRGVAYQGREPVVLPGRTGEQYLGYVQYNTAEMYQALMIEDDQPVDKTGQIEPFAPLFAAAKKKRKYGPYAAKFERFLVRVTETTLEMAKAYLPDDAVIAATGRREQVNIAEFRKTSPLNQQIKVEARGETIETQLGKQLTFQHLLQYVGKQLDPKMIGKLAKNLPFGNHEEAFDDFTVDEDIAKNDMLALERGEPVEPTTYVDPVYMVKKLTARIKKPDYKFLPEPVRQGYDQLKQAYNKTTPAPAPKLAAAKNEYIPVDGALVTVDMYVPDEKDPANQAKRAKLPQRSLEWLMKQLEAQGASQEKLEDMNVTALSEMAEMMLAQKAQAQGQAPGQNARPPVPSQMAG
jgi:hypothetical protein